MKWIKTGRQLGQAVKNVQRLRQITAILARHGFADVVQRMNLGKFLPSRATSISDPKLELSMATRLRMAFEELGPTYVKLGQVLSMRSDLLPEAYIEEFTKLQDDVQPMESRLVRTLVERELGKTIEELYETFDEKPLAAASIGQVHAATLKTGEKVVVKVQRDGIEKTIENDVSLLAFLAGLLEKYVPETQVIGPRTIVDEFFRTLSFELDYVIESNNMAKMAENMKIFPQIVIPTVYKSHSNTRILTLERLEGIRVNNSAALDAAEVDRKRIVDIGARAFFHSVMVNGLFHGDLHGGNLFILPGNQLGIIDFGIVGRLSEKSRDQLANMVLSLVNEDYENLCYQYAELGSAASSIDFDSFQKEVRNTLSPYLGLSLKEINIGKVLIEATRIATEYQIKVPGDWMIVFKAILTIEGLGRTLDPDFDLMALGQDVVKSLVKEQYSSQRLMRDFLWVAKDVSVLLQTLPRQIRWMFKKFNSNDFAFEIKSPDLSQIGIQIDRHGQRTSHSILIVGLFIAASIALQHPDGHKVGDYPIIAVALFSGGTFFLIRTLFSSKN